MRDLPTLLRRGDLLVFNDTKVIPARLKGVRGGASGRQDVAVEALLIRDLGGGRWLAFARPAKRLRPGGGLTFAGGLSAKVEAKNEDGSVVLAFDTVGPAFVAALDTGGAVPLPPYIAGGVPTRRTASTTRRCSPDKMARSLPPLRPAFHSPTCWPASPPQASPARL